MGIEVPFGRTFTFDLFYTYLQAEDKSSPTQMALEHRPKHKMDARLHLKLPSGFYLFTNLSFVSSLFYYEGETQLKLDPHAVVDMKISKRFGDQFNLHLSIRNLFDKYYYESEGYPREGRMILGGIQYDLQQ